MAEDIQIGIKTSATLVPVPLANGLHELQPEEWDLVLERGKALWKEILDLIATRRLVEECCADQFALQHSLAGLLGQRLEGIVRVELSWSIRNAPPDAGVNVLVKDQPIHRDFYRHSQTAEIKPNAGCQTYPLAVNQPHEGTLFWSVNDHAPASLNEVGDIIQFVVEVRRTNDLLRSETVPVLMPRARP